MSIRCEKCGHENAQGSLMCASCYTLFVKVNVVGQSTTLFGNDRGDQGYTEVDPQETKGVLNLSTSRSPSANDGTEDYETITLRIKGAEQPLVIQIETQAVLGRYTPDSNSQPRIDLTPYNAFEKGVSRMHAMLRRTTNGLNIEDMASSNGTFVNDSRLQPYTATPIRSGDKVRLSQIEMQIFIGELAEQP